MCRLFPDQRAPPVQSLPPGRPEQQLRWRHLGAHYRRHEPLVEVLYPITPPGRRELQAEGGAPAGRLDRRRSRGPPR